MSDNDDLFEFDEFDDTDLELDLDDLFGDLASLVVDTDDPSLLEPPTAPAEEPVAASMADAGAPAPVQPVTPQPEPVAADPAPPVKPAAQPAAAQQPMQPVHPAMAAHPYAQPAPGQVAGIDPAALQSTGPAKRLNKVSMAVGAALVITCANLASMAIPHLAAGDDPLAAEPAIVERVEGAEGEGPADAGEQAMLARITELEALIHKYGSPGEQVTSARGDYTRVIDEASSMIARGDYVGARKRLYSVLATVDRMPARERDRNEALASYLLADTYKLEARAQTQEAGL